MIDLRHGDCLEIMATLPDNSVDLVLTDPPYGTTACKWDSVIPFEPMWEQLKRITKKKAAIVMTASQPFTTMLISSNMKGFKYCCVWDKVVPSGMTYAKYRPMSIFEDVVVFSNTGGKTTYNPQMILRDKPIKSKNYGSKREDRTHVSKPDSKVRIYTHKNPTSVITFLKVRGGSVHPTQKPVALMEYLIKTYSNEGETVLDFTMGSGTTGVACVNTNRKFIGIEKDDAYFDICKQRILGRDRQEPNIVEPDFDQQLELCL